MAPPLLPLWHSSASGKGNAIINARITSLLTRHTHNYHQLLPFPVALLLPPSRVRAPVVIARVRGAVALPLRLPCCCSPPLLMAPRATHYCLCLWPCCPPTSFLTRYACNYHQLLPSPAALLLLGDEHAELQSIDRVGGLVDVLLLPVAE